MQCVCMLYFCRNNAGIKPAAQWCRFRNLWRIFWVASLCFCFSARYFTSTLHDSGRLASVGWPQISLLLWLDVGNNISLSLSLFQQRIAL